MTSTTPAQTPLDPCAVTILTGFLGSGKTTVLNSILRAPHGQRMAVIVNEFGSVGVDGALVSGGDRFVELENGCLCCVLNDDLERTLLDLLDQAPLDHIIIETTGIADPLPVTWACGRPMLSKRLRVDAVVTVIDACHLKAALDEAQETATQLQRADILLLNKLDLVKDGGQNALALARKHNSLAPALLWQGDPLPIQLVLGRHQRNHEKTTEASTPGHKTHSLIQHLSFVFAPGTIIDERLAEDLALDIDEAVFRFKALLRVDSPLGSHLLLNGVAGRLDLRFVTPDTPPAHSVWQFFGQTLPYDGLIAQCETLGPRLL